MYGEKIDFIQYLIDPQVATRIHEKLARRHNLIPIGIEEDKIRVAMVNPDDLFAKQDVKIVTGMEVIPFQVEEETITGWINQIYATSKAQSLVREVEEKLEQEIREKQTIEESIEIHNAGDYLRLANSIIEEGMAMGASDIHIEPQKVYVRVRYRLDGELQERRILRKEMLSPITTCIKNMASLDIAEKRIPQDGRVTQRIGEEEVDLRINVLPTVWGEKTMIRMMYRKDVDFNLDQLGFYEDDLVKFKRLLKNPYGLILITGPTGSGKSTTLATALRALNQKNVNIITVEDPVETMIEGVNQVAVHTRAGLTFGATLRAILRQDPDVLMIGEMRDKETMDIAIRAAITGHLVLSTLHTNNATSSIARLMDMGMENYLVGTAIKGVSAQRLVRKICPKCKVAYKVNEQDAKRYGVPLDTLVYKGKGCKACHHTGYKGRKAVHELFVLDSDLQDMISSKRLTSDQIRRVAIQRGMRTLWQNAYEDVLNGITTLEEMQKIAYQQ